MEQFGGWLKEKFKTNSVEKAVDLPPTTEGPPPLPKKLGIQKNTIRPAEYEDSEHETEIPQLSGEERLAAISRCEHLLAENGEFTYDILHSFIKEAVHVTGGSHNLGSNITNNEMFASHTLIDEDTGLEYGFHVYDWPSPEDRGEDSELSNIGINIFRDEYKAGPELSATPLRFMEFIEVAKDGSSFLRIEDANAPQKNKQYSRILGRYLDVSPETTSTYELHGTSGLTLEIDDLSGTELRTASERILEMIKTVPEV